MAEKRKYDEDLQLSSFASWVILILFCACIVVFGYVVYRVIPDVPRAWDMGQLGDTPAATIFSTEQPAQGGKLQRQVPMLPGAYPPSRVPAERRVRGD